MAYEHETLREAVRDPIVRHIYDHSDIRARGSVMRRVFIPVENATQRVLARSVRMAIWEEVG